MRVIVMVEKDGNSNGPINQGEQSFTYSTKKIDWGNRQIEVHQYEFEFPDNKEIKGAGARVIYQTLDYFEKVEMKTDSSRTLKQKGIKGKDKIAFIKELYPYGRWTENDGKTQPENNESGVKILNLIFEKGAANDIKAAYMFTTNEKLIKLAEKSNLESVNKKNSKIHRFIKIFDQKK